jgi:DNA mismatch repair protein MSH5
MLRQWFLRPSLSFEVINTRHDAVSVLLRPENQVSVDAMHSHLKGLKNVPRLLGILRAGKATIVEWQSLVKVILLIFELIVIEDSKIAYSLLSTQA